MLDDLRQQASESDYLKGLEEPVPEPPKKQNILQRFSPAQRFVIAALLFAGALVVGIVLLLATGTIVLP
jgi:hypothetical protein